MVGDLVRKTEELGCILSGLPPGLGVTYTYGESGQTGAQTDTILPAAIELLPDFRGDSRPLPSGGSVQHVEAFVRRQHPSWRFNNAVTLTVWALGPGQDVESQVDLKVTCWT